MTEVPGRERLVKWFGHEGGILNKLGIGGRKFRFRRWTGPILLSVKGIPDPFAESLQQAWTALCSLIGREFEAVPFGEGNLAYIGVDGWLRFASDRELRGLIPGMERNVSWLQRQGMSQYRLVLDRENRPLTRYVAALNFANDRISGRSPAALGLSQAVLMVMEWGPGFWEEGSILTAEPAHAGDLSVLRPGLREVLRAAYDPDLPDISTNPDIVTRLAAKARALAAGTA